MCYLNRFWSRSFLNIWFLSRQGIPLGGVLTVWYYFRFPKQETLKINLSRFDRFLAVYHVNSNYFPSRRKGRLVDAGATKTLLTWIGKG